MKVVPFLWDEDPVDRFSFSTGMVRGALADSLTSGHCPASPRTGVSPTLPLDFLDGDRESDIEWVLPATVTDAEDRSLGRSSFVEDVNRCFWLRTAQTLVLGGGAAAIVVCPVGGRLEAIDESVVAVSAVEEVVGGVPFIDGLVGESG